MSAFWTVLAAAGRNDGVQPRLSSRFEQMETLPESDAPPAAPVTAQALSQQTLPRESVRESAEQHSAATVLPPQPEAMQSQLPSHSPAPPASPARVTAEHPEQHVPGTPPVLHPYATIRTEIRREIRREVPVVRPVAQASAASLRTAVASPATEDIASSQPAELPQTSAESPELPIAAPTVPVAAARQTVAADRPVESVPKPTRPHRGQASAENAPIQPAITLEPIAVPQQSQSTESTIHVTIGRIEIRANTPQPQPTPPQPRFQPALTLDDYLKQRNGDGR
ncbi:MAG: hypothetical protein M9928_20435 [Anaerolineae bacterium]|nr:hypothetical protein [Anaerolineae bacterium]MCO5207383.1 hypothetical protein [Anaerolineae bacterium]